MPDKAIFALSDSVCGYELPKLAQAQKVPVFGERGVVCLCLLISAKKVGWEVWIVTVVALRVAPACGRCQSSANASKKQRGHEPTPGRPQAAATVGSY